MALPDSACFEHGVDDCPYCNRSPVQAARMPLDGRRRWFQFSLRTLFVVVTVSAVWLGWELKFIRDRKALRKSIVDGGGTVQMASYHRDIGFDPKYPGAPVMPPWRRWLGDEPIGCAVLPPGSSKIVLARATRTFPEALVVYNRLDF